VSNYKLLTEENKSIAEKIAVADFIFWSSFSQYQFYGQFSKATAVHACAGGETAALLKQQGIEPVIFPTIKSFEEWRRSSIRPHSVA
jgi:uroporphyrinogen-III synthase